MKHCVVCLSSCRFLASGATHQPEILHGDISLVYSRFGALPQESPNTRPKRGRGSEFWPLGNQFEGYYLQNGKSYKGFVSIRS